VILACTIAYKKKDVKMGSHREFNLPDNPSRTLFVMDFVRKKAIFCGFKKIDVLYRYLLHFFVETGVKKRSPALKDDRTYKEAGLTNTSLLNFQAKLSITSRRRPCWLSGTASSDAMK
jgi:hypothetical protein